MLAKLQRLATSIFYGTMWLYAVWAFTWPAFSFVQGEHLFGLKVAIGFIAVSALFAAASAFANIEVRARWLQEHLRTNHWQALDETSERHLAGIVGALLESPIMGIYILYKLARGY